MSARRPAHAGTFYPADPQRLGALVEVLLREAAECPAPDGEIVGLVVPHAGLMYSGAIAALGWAAIGRTAPETIVLAGTDHQARAAGIGVWTGGPWRSPLGEVEIDTELARRIAGLDGSFADHDAAHLDEHSLEVQVPFIARACPGSRIVPLAVSPRLRSHAASGAALGRLVAQLRSGGGRIALVASSDFAHYPAHDVAVHVDALLTEPILRLDGDELLEIESGLLDAGLPGLACGLCGIDPVRFTLAALRGMGVVDGTLLGAATSADAGGDPRRTVGYAAIAFAAGA